MYDPGRGTLVCSVRPSGPSRRKEVLSSVSSVTVTVQSASPPGEVESVALEYYPWRAHLRDPESYWITVSQAADILGVSDAELRRMLNQRRLPFYTHKSGVRLMRRRQIEEIAAHGHGRPARTRTHS